MNKRVAYVRITYCPTPHGRRKPSFLFFICIHFLNWSRPDEKNSRLFGRRSVFFKQIPKNFSFVIQKFRIRRLFRTMPTTRKKRCEDASVKLPNGQWVEILYDEYIIVLVAIGIRSPARNAKKKKHTHKQFMNNITFCRGE